MLFSMKFPGGWRICLFFILLGISSGESPESGSARKIVIGRVEKVSFPDFGFSLEARVDTGAIICALHVTNRTIIGEGEDRVVEFDTVDQDGKVIHLKSKVLRMTRIKNSGGESEERLVIREKVKVGPVTRTVNISLADRTELKYGFLLGRNFLRGKFTVDVSRSHTQP